MELLIDLGQFLGFSDAHSSFAVNVCHLSTGYVSPQYHLVFDNLFETLFSAGNDILIDDICNCLFNSDQDMYFHDDEFISHYPLVYHLPPLNEVWLSEPEYRAWRQELEEHHCPSDDCDRVKLIDATPDEPSNPLPNLIEKIVHLQS